MNKYTDKTIWNKKSSIHKGKALANIPNEWFKYSYEEKDCWGDPLLRKYIEENKDIFKIKVKPKDTKLRNTAWRNRSDSR